MLGTQLDQSHHSVAPPCKSGLKRLTLERSWHDTWRTTKSMSCPDSETDLDPLASQSRIRLGSSQLLQMAREAADKVDFRRLTNRHASLRNWTRKTMANDFTAFSHGDGKEAAREVLVTGTMKASLSELSHILSSSTGRTHDRVMRSLYKDYIHGAVVHVVDPSFETPTLALNVDMESRLTVKTSAFKRSRMFRNHEQWCFLEYLEKASSADAFTVTLSSVPAHELLAGKMKVDRVDELPDLTAAYLIEKIPASHLVRVVFVAQAALLEGAPLDQSIRSHTSDRACDRHVPHAKKRQKRLMRLAIGASKLPDVVRSRRFGVQSLADCSAFVATNSRCTCCAKSHCLLFRKRQCHLCGYLICNQCWSLHAMESRDGRVSSVRACTRCVEFVNHGDYSQVDPTKRGRIAISADATLASVAPPGKALINFLHEALQTSSGTKRTSVMAVIRHLMNLEKADADTCSVRSSTTTSSVRLIDDDVTKYADALNNGVLHVESLLVEECVLANTKGRNYPLNTAPKPTVMSDFPMPKDEQERVAAIQRGGFGKITDTEELDLICELLTREMKCSIGLVTLIKEDEQHVLASNLLSFRQLHMPRNESFCQHTIMNEEPLLVPHPEADIRFQNLPALLAHDLRFYLGFPLKDENDQIVGSVCCLDNMSHDVTASQYSTMKKLAETASRVVQMKGKQVA